MLIFNATLRYVVCVEGTAVASSNRYAAACAYVAWVMPGGDAMIVVIRCEFYTEYVIRDLSDRPGARVGLVCRNAVAGRHVDVDSWDLTIGNDVVHVGDGEAGRAECEAVAEARLGVKTPWRSTK